MSQAFPHVPCSAYSSCLRFRASSQADAFCPHKSPAPPHDLLLGGRGVAGELRLCPHLHHRGWSRGAQRHSSLIYFANTDFCLFGVVNFFINYPILPGPSAGAVRGCCSVSKALSAQSAFLVLTLLHAIIQHHRPLSAIWEFFVIQITFIYCNFYPLSMGLTNFETASFVGGS